MPRIRVGEDAHRRSAHASLGSLRELADEDLMQLVRRGEAAAFEVVVERHQRAAFGLAFRMCGKRAVAEDVAQEAFLSLWRSNARYDRTRGSVRTWVLGVVHNRAVDVLRRGTPAGARGQISDEGLEERLEEPQRTETEVARREEAREVRSAIGELPAEQQRVITLAYFGGFTQTEIAAMIDVPVGTVKGRMRLGLARMRTAMLVEKT